MKGFMTDHGSEINNSLGDESWIVDEENNAVDMNETDNEITRNGNLSLHSYLKHDDSHQMETFSALLALCAGNSPVNGEFPSQRPVTRSTDVFFDLRVNKNSSKQREAGDMRGHRAHYDVTVMVYLFEYVEFTE